MNRRLMLGNAIGGEVTPDSWDINWDYSMGDPSGYGLSLRKSGNGSAQFVSDEGVYLKANNVSYAYMYLEPDPALTLTDKCIVEVEFDLISVATGGASGLWISVATSSGGIIFRFADIGSHLIRVEKNGDVNRIFLDGASYQTNLETGSGINVYSRKGAELYVKSYKISVN